MEQPKEWQFGSFTLLPTQRLLLDGDATVRVGGRALDVLIVLVEAAGQVVGRDELMARVWRKVIVDDGSLRVHIAALRRALGDDGNSRRYIVNVPGRGYSFVGDARQRARSTAAGVDRVARQLPPLLVSVIGRDEAIREVAATVVDHRLVTIVGAGGIGKTTVALASATQLATRFRDGARFVDLAPLTDSRHVAVQVANAVADTVADADVPVVLESSDLGVLLADRQLLIVLDNCEHVVHAAAEIAEVILSEAPGVRLLATSREPLRAAGECVLRLSALELPPASARLTAQQALGFSAIHLFVERTGATVSGFELADEDVPLVTAISRDLDGIPLAIELAAGRVAQLGLHGLSARLRDRFAVLTKGRRTALPRQQTLRAAVDWSYELLSEEQKAVLCRLAVFAGAFSFDSAVAVCEDDVSADVCDAIDELVMKSLIVIDTTADARQYRLLEVTRAYALEKLKDAGELVATSRSHALHVCSVFERLEADSPHDRTWEARYARWMDDIQVAVQASVHILKDPSLSLRLLAATASAWFQRSLIDEYRSRAEEALGMAGRVNEQPEATLMRLWLSLGLCYWHTKGSGRDVARAFERTYELAQRLRHVEFERMGLWGLCVEHLASGDYAAALGNARKYAALTSPDAGHEVAIQSRHLMQVCLHVTGDQLASEAEATAALRLVRRTDQERVLSRFQPDPHASIKAFLSRALWIRGRADQALVVAAEAVHSARSTQHDVTLCFALFGQCAVLLWCGRWVDLGREADALMEVATKRRLSHWKAWAQTYKDAHAYRAKRVLVQQWRDSLCGPNQLEMMATVSSELLDGEVLVRASAGRSPWCAPEVLRAHGEKLLRHGSATQEAEPWFVRSLDLARSSGSLAWELRAATSLARCWFGGDRRREAAALLAGVLERHTEGLDTVDVQRARLMLNS